MKNAKTIDSVVAALYESISGPAVRPRNWRKLRELFHPSGRLLRTLVSESKTTVAAMTVDEFIAVAEPYFREQSFYERELARRTEQFGHIAHVWSTYAAFAAPDASSPLGRGINSIQLWFDGARWCVMSMLWDDERPRSSLPRKYLQIISSTKTNKCESSPKRRE